MINDLPPSEASFVGQRTHSGDIDIWHGYPEAWDKVPWALKEAWQSKGLVSRRDLRRWKTTDNVGLAWKESELEDE